MARKKAPSDWQLVQLPVLDIHLDPENARVDATAKTGQARLREMLCQHEDVAGLAHKIIKANGILPAEQIIVIDGGEHYVVVEGNRRVCASQLMVDPTLRPSGYKRKIPDSSEELAERLATIQAVIAPSREAAETFITQKHTEAGTKPWGPQAKQRRVARLLAAGRTIEQVAEQLRMGEGPARKLASEHNLVTYVKKLKCWSPDEREKLDDPGLQVNPL